MVVITILIQEASGLYTRRKPQDLGKYSSDNSHVNTEGLRTPHKQKSSGLHINVTFITIFVQEASGLYTSESPQEETQYR